MTAAHELRAAHTIIRNALAVMTAAQKLKWGDLNTRDGVDGEGITRAHDRATAMASAHDLAHELRTAAALFTQDAQRAGDADRVCLSPPGAVRLADLLSRAAAALATPTTKTEGA